MQNGPGPRRWLLGPGALETPVLPPSPYYGSLDPQPGAVLRHNNLDLVPSDIVDHRLFEDISLEPAH